MSTFRARPLLAWNINLPTRQWSVLRADLQQQPRVQAAAPAERAISTAVAQASSVR